jgi:hypothetical protein
VPTWIVNKRLVMSTRTRDCYHAFRTGGFTQLLWL